MKIVYEDKIREDAVSIILVPEQAIKEPGYIQCFSMGSNSSNKHEYHALAQMAYFQYQDDELTIFEVTGNIEIHLDDQKETMNSGMMLFREKNGAINAIVHRDINKKKILEIVYRYCTRWVRLDI